MFLFYPSAASSSTVVPLLLNVCIYTRLVKKKPWLPVQSFVLKCQSFRSYVLFVVCLDVEPLVLCFRVKYYPSDPLMLKEELTRC